MIKGHKLSIMSIMSVDDHNYVLSATFPYLLIPDCFHDLYSYWPFLCVSPQWLHLAWLACPALVPPPSPPPTPWMAPALVPAPCPRARRVARCRPAPPKRWRCLAEEKQNDRKKEREWDERSKRKGKMKHDNNAETRWMGYLFVTKQLLSFPTKSIGIWMVREREGRRKRNRVTWVENKNPSLYNLSPKQSTTGCSAINMSL